MTDPAKTVAFTGHRPEKIRGGKDETGAEVQHIKDELKRLILDKISGGCIWFLTGMAMGADIWAAETVLSLKKEHPYIRLVAAVPFPGQSDGFPQSWKERYRAVLSRCDEVHTISLQRQPGCYMLRNKWLVEHSSHIIGVYNGSRGGSMQTLNMALLNGSDIKIIHC